MRSTVTNCPECEGNSTKVTDSRMYPGTGCRRRRYTCKLCHIKWNTYELREGFTFSPLLPDKLQANLIECLATSPNSTKIGILRNTSTKELLEELLRRNLQPTNTKKLPAPKA